MKHLALIVLLFLCSACRRDGKANVSLLGLSTNNAANGPRAGILLWGQSNAHLEVCLAFARAMTQLDGSKVYQCIDAHEGGTPISRWVPGADLYARGLERARTANIPIAAMLWYQGESDAQNGCTQTWGNQFTGTINQVRLDLRLPDLPVIYAQLNSTTLPNFMGWDCIKDQQASLYLPNSRMVRTDDIGIDPSDGIHYTIDGYREVGKRMALAYGQVIGL